MARKKTAAPDAGALSEAPMTSSEMMTLAATAAAVAASTDDAPYKPTAAPEPPAAAPDAAPQEREPTPRERAMEAISNKRIAEFEREAQVTIARTDPDTPPADAAPAEDTPPADAVADQVDRQTAPADEPTVLAENLGRFVVKGKVDGQDVTYTVEQLLADAQKNSAAQRRLDEAARLLREAQEQRDQVARQTEKPAEISDDDPRKIFLNAMFEGDESKALDALDKVMGGQKDVSTVDPAKIVSDVKQQIVLDSALDTFAREYADIVADPYLAAFADQRLQQHLQAGVPLTDAFKRAGEGTRDWIRQKAGIATPNPTPTTPRSDKLERKAAIDNVPAASATAVTTEPTPQSRSEVIADMRRARGLAA